jgi:SAM-dependent methyltransferase
VYDCLVLELWVAAAVLLFVPYDYLPWALVVVALLGLPGIRARWGGAPYVWTDKKTQATMVRFASIKPGDVVYDLGCGDGRLIRAAARKGALAYGVEASLLTCSLAWMWSLPVRNARIRFGDLWAGRYDDADVVFCYMLVKGMERFEREIWPTLKPGCRVVSNSFKMKGVEPEKTEGGVYLYRKS